MAPVNRAPKAGPKAFEAGIAGCAAVLIPISVPNYTQLNAVFMLPASIPQCQ